ncbi:ATP-binding protein [Haladaptatus sp. NG-WS-4]
MEITTTDDGPGIPSEEQSVLSEGRETALQHGSGLGLWLTNWVVGKFGGELTFGANQSRGSVVTIRLPRAESSVDGGRSAASGNLSTDNDRRSISNVRQTTNES